MAAAKFLQLQTDGRTKEISGATSGGGADADKIPALDASGRFAAGMMPSGFGADVNVVTTSEALAAGNLVNVWSGGVRKADATVVGKEANGFVLAAFGSGVPATVYAEGTNDQVTGLTVGQRLYLSTIAGGITTTAPVGAGNVVQHVGVAITATSFNFNAGQSFERA